MPRIVEAQPHQLGVGQDLVGDERGAELLGGQWRAQLFDDGNCPSECGLGSLAVAGCPGQEPERRLAAVGDLGQGSLLGGLQRLVQQPTRRSCLTHGAQRVAA